MSKAPQPQQNQRQADHHANQLNPNKGTPGTNPANAQMHGNRGKQQHNPNQG